MRVVGRILSKYPHAFNSVAIFCSSTVIYCFYSQGSLVVLPRLSFLNRATPGLAVRSQQSGHARHTHAKNHEIIVDNRVLLMATRTRVFGQPNYAVAGTCKANLRGNCGFPMQNSTL